MPSCGTGSVGTQFVVRSGFGGAVCACGVDGAGGACAKLAAGSNANAMLMTIGSLFVMAGKRRSVADVPFTAKDDQPLR